MTHASQELLPESPRLLYLESPRLLSLFDISVLFWTSFLWFWWRWQGKKQRWWRLYLYLLQPIRNLPQKCVKQQGWKPNQGPAVHLTIMLHSLCKKYCAWQCEAVQGESHLFSWLICLSLLTLLMTLCKSWCWWFWIQARSLDEGGGDSKPNVQLSEDCWYYKNMKVSFMKTQMNQGMIRSLLFFMIRE